MLFKKNNFEIFIYIIIYAFLFINAYIMQDSYIAIVSAFCGMTYTLLAGKGVPICYPIGIIGTFFYSYLSFSSNLWGNLLLSLLYYLPMQIIGFIQWNKNLKKDKYEVLKTKLSSKERLILSGLVVFLAVPSVIILGYCNDSYPILDGIITTLSVVGMYLTVRRVFEQWVVWMMVNGLSFILWITIAINGEKVFSTALMWLIYFFLAIYFYICWQKEIIASEHQ